MAKTEKKVTSPEIVDSMETLAIRIGEIKEAQRQFSTYTQEQVDAIFKAAATAANKARIPLNNMANPIKIIKVIMGFKDTLSFLFCIIIT